MQMSMLEKTIKEMFTAIALDNQFNSEVKEKISQYQK